MLRNTGEQSLSEWFLEQVARHHGTADVDDDIAEQLQDPAVAAIYAASAFRTRLFLAAIKRRRQLFAQGLTMAEFVLKMGVFNTPETAEMKAYLAHVNTDNTQPVLSKTVRDKLAKTEAVIRAFESQVHTDSLRFLEGYLAAVGMYMTYGTQLITDATTKARIRVRYLS